MTLVESTEVVVPLERAVLGTGLPVATCNDTVFECAVVQHGQVKAAPIPRHQSRRIAIDALEKPSDQLAFARFEITQTPNLQGVTTTQNARDRHDAMLLVRQKLATAMLARMRKHGFGNLTIREPLEAKYATPQLEIGNCFNIEN